MRQKMGISVLIKPIWGSSQSWERLLTVTRATQRRLETRTGNAVPVSGLVHTQSLDGRERDLWRD